MKIKNHDSEQSQSNNSTKGKNKCRNLTEIYLQQYFVFFPLAAGSKIHSVNTVSCYIQIPKCSGEIRLHLHYITGALLYQSVMQ